MAIGETIGLIEALKGNGSSLPAITSSDNGKVLAVKDGAWAAGTPYVLVTQENNVATLKGSEINSLAASGVEVLMRDSDGLYAFVSNSGSTAVFSGVTSALEAKKVSVNDIKGVSRSSRSVYSKPSGGIPETDLAQAVKDKLNKFVVTLTPTSPDYSGTMDKTPQEITAAYNAGQKIVFDIPAMSATVDADQYVSSSVSVNNLRFGAKVFFEFNNAPVLITIITNGADDAQTYLTGIYPLTPAS